MSRMNKEFGIKSANAIKNLRMRTSYLSKSSVYVASLILRSIVRGEG